MSGCIGGSCVARKWAGMGTTTEKPTNAALAKENNDKLAQLMAERTRQDAALSGQEEQVKPTTTQTSVAVPVFSSTRGF